MLSWTLSNALDDRSSGNEYDIPTVLDAWKRVGLSGFPPSGSLSHGRQTSTRYAGSTGYFELSVGEEPESRLILSYTGKRDTTALPGVGEPTPVVQWMVGRIN